MATKKEVNVKAQKSDGENEDEGQDLTVTARKGDGDQEPEEQVSGTPEADEDGAFEESVTSNKEASNPFFVSNADPTDPNGYNNAPHAAEGFIANPVAGGGVPVGTGEFDVVNGITQLEGDDLPESNVDPEGVIEKLRKDQNAALAKQKKASKN